MVSEELLSEIDRGEGEPLSQIARRVPRTRESKPVTLSCVLRWVLNGARGPDGDRVKLEAVRIAGRWISTPGALRRWILAQVEVVKPPTALRTSARRQQASERARRQLEKLGI